MEALGRAGADDHEALGAGARDREVAHELAALAQHRREADPARRRQASREQPVEPGFRARAGDLVLAVVRDLQNPDALAHRPALLPHGTVRVRAPEGRDLLGGRSFGREPERMLEPEARAEDRAPRLQPVVDRGRPLRPRGRQLLVRESYRKPPAVVLAHLGVGVGARREVAEAGDVHREHVHAGVALDDPVGEREADAAALREPRHHAAGAIEVAQPRHRADQRIAVRGEGERAVDHALDAGARDRGEMGKRELEAGRDPVEVGRQELMAEVAWRRARRPRHARLLVGADEQALAFLAGVDLGLEVDRVRQLLLALRDLGQIVGDQVVVLHREHRQLQPDQAADLARPEPGRVDHDLGRDAAGRRDHEPAAALLRAQLGHRREAVDLGAGLARRLGVGLGHARGVDVALVGIEQRALEMPGLDQRMAALDLVERDELALEAEQAAAGMGGLEEVEALGRAGEHDPAGQMDAAGLARERLDLLVQPDRVVLQLGDVGVAVDRVHAARGVPGRAGGQLIALEQHDVAPAELGQVVEHAAADDPAADHHHPRLGPHPAASRFSSACYSLPVRRQEQRRKPLPMAAARTPGPDARRPGRFAFTARRRGGTLASPRQPSVLQGRGPRTREARP